MFGFGKRHEAAGNTFVYDQALIIRIPQANELGDERVLEKILEFEEALAEILPSKAGVDGHEVGDYEAVIYIYGSDADGLYDASRKLLSDYFSGQGAEITLQYGLAEDPATKEKKLHI